MWSPQGRWLAGFCGAGCAARPDAPDGVPVPLHVLDLRKGSLHRTILVAQRAPGGTASASFSPDDAFLATAHQSGVERLFRVDDGKLLRELTLTAVYEPGAFSPDGARVVFGSVLGDTTLLGLPRGEVVHAASVPNPFAAAAPIAFAWSPTGERLAVTRGGTELRDGRTGARTAEIPGGHRAGEVLFQWRAGGGEVLHATCDGLVERLRPEPFGVIEVLRAPGVETSCAIAATRDGSLVLRGTDDGLDVFDVVSRTARVLSAPGAQMGPLFLSPDEKRAAQLRLPDPPVAGEGGPRYVVQVFELTAATPSPPVSLGATEALGWAPGGELYRIEQGEIVAWSPVEKRDVFRAAFESTIESAALSGDGRFVAVADGQLALVRTSDHALLRVAIGDENAAPRVTPGPEPLTTFLR